MFREKLIEMRQAKALSQRELAELAKVAFGTIQRAEKNGQITVESLKKIAGALGMPPAYFLS